MDLREPPSTDDGELSEWLEDLHRWLKYPALQAYTIKSGNMVDGNYIDIQVGGNLLFVGTAGMVFAEISVKDNTDAVTLNSTAKVQITNFNINGLSNNATPDHTNDHITIVKAGKYFVSVSLAVQNNASQTHKVDVSLWKDNGTTEFTNIHNHRTLSGGSTDVGAISISGIIDADVDDTLELWADTSAAANRSVTFEDLTFLILQIGG
jgi:hypothetical protein